MNTKRIIVLGIALVAASAAALLARGLMGGGTPKVEAKIAPPPMAMSEVLVARSNIQPGLALKSDMVKWQSWPTTAVDSSFITHAAAPNLDDALKSTVVRVPLYAGEPISNTAIVHGDAAGFMAAQLQPGMRAVSITISVDSGAGGFILPNDRVDLMLTTKVNDSSPPRARVKTILSDVRVLAVDQTFSQDKNTKTVVGKTATLELTPGQAELVAAAQNSGMISLSLRGLGDNEAVATGRAPGGDDGPVAVIRYGIMKPNDNSATVQGGEEPMIRKGLLLGACLLLAIPATAATTGTTIGDNNARVIQITTGGGAPAHQSITLGVGKSAVVELDTEAHDVMVSSPDIVDAVVRSPRRIFLLGQKTGQTNAFFFDGAGHQVLSLDIRVEKDVTDLATMMRSSLPNSAIKVSAMNDSVVLSGSVASASESNRAAELAASFTADPKKVVNMLGIAGGEQVMLKVRIAEMDRNIAKQFGVNVSGTGNIGGVPMALGTANPFGLLGHALADASGAQFGSSCAGAFFPTGTSSASSTLTTGNNTINTITNGATNSTTSINNATNNPALLTPGQASGSTVLGSMVGSAVQTITSGVPTVTSTANTATSCISPNNAQGILQALEQVGLVHMLAEPNLTAVSGETAKMLAGGEFPVPVAKDNQGNITVDFKTFGVGLSFTPVVLSPGRISLQISTEDSELSTTGAFTLQGGNGAAGGGIGSVGGVTIPALAVRRAETTVEVPSGGSFAIAGLMQHVTKQVIDGFPGLKDMPVLGALFRSRDYQNDETELVVVITAYLVAPTTEAALASPTDGFVAPTDPETLLLGRLNAVYKKSDKPLTPQAAAPVGFVVR